MYSLGIDTSNYATSLAVIDYTVGEVVCDLKRFLPVVQGERGLRQSDALFHHTQALPQMLLQLNEKCDLSVISSVGVSTRPRSVEGSYMPCFSAGVSFATAISATKKLPLTQVSHQDGHIAAALFALGNKGLFDTQMLVFHVSGGTTELLLCNGAIVKEKLFDTSDLYAGQAVDRIGVRMGLQFPAGEALSALSEKCKDIIIPKVSIKDKSFSFSGLENQCNALLEKNASDEYIAKYCLSQVGYTILQMIKLAQKAYPMLPIICAGGVMCSNVIRTIILAEIPNTKFVPAKFSSDNAIGVAALAARECVC